jgi:hypothetical protein
MYLSRWFAVCSLSLIGASLAHAEIVKGVMAIKGAEMS